MKIRIDKYSGRPFTLADERRDAREIRKVRGMKHSPVRLSEGQAGRVSGYSVSVFSQDFDFLDDVLSRDDLYSD